MFSGYCCCRRELGVGVVAAVSLVKGREGVNVAAEVFANLGQ